MVAQFPSAIRAFAPKVDLSDTVMADHVNALQEEVSAIENTLSNGILSSSWTGTWIGAATWANVDQRITNIEYGLLNGVTPAPYVSVSGGSSINTNSLVGILLKASSGTADLVQTKNPSGTLKFKVDVNGIPYVGTAPVLYLNSTEYNNLLSSINSAQGAANAASANSIHPFLLAGM